MLEKFIRFFKERNLLQESQHFIAAVSGGVDSVVLCELCRKAGIRFSIVHCNFQLRGEESERDEQFVRSLGTKYNVDVMVEKFDTVSYAAEKKISIQEAARDLRYQWFDRLVQERKYIRTLLAHHADDNIETLLMNFFRGTGLQGLTGMPGWNDTDNYCLRPLLDVRRKEIKEFAVNNNLKWVEDSSNASAKYTRNYFRNELIPSIKIVFPQVEENLLDNIERFRKVNNLYQVSVADLKARISVRHLAEVRIPAKKLLLYQHTSLIYEIIRDYGFGEKQVDEIIKLAKAESGKFIENDHYQVIRHRNWLIFAPRFVKTDTVAIEQQAEKIRFNGGWLDITSVTPDRFHLEKSGRVAQLDARHVEYPLLLRRWRQGDYFYPLGMAKKKKLSRFFIDQKLPKNQKENIWVLESHKRIVWVVGMRIDDRFKITPNTQNILRIAISSA